MLSCLLTLSIWRSKHAMHWMLCLSRLLVLLSKHIHTFLPITFFIFNWFSIQKKFWKAEIEGFSNIPSILYMSTLLIQVMAFYTKYNTFNAMHVDTVETVEKSWFWAFQNFKRIENWLNIKEVIAKMCWQCQHCWYSWKALILSFPKLFSDWKLVEY